MFTQEVEVLVVTMVTVLEALVMVTMENDQFLKKVTMVLVLTLLII